MEGFTLEEAAHLSDESALRKCYDQRNIAVLRWYAWGFGFVSFFETIAALAEWQTWRIPIALLNLALSLLLIVLFRRMQKERLNDDLLLDRLARRLENQFRTFVQGYLVGQFVLIVVFNYGWQGAIPWMMTFPFLLMVCRFVPAERLYLHALIFGGTFMLDILWPAAEGMDTGVVIGAGSVHAFTFFVGTWVNRRFKKKFLREWDQEKSRAREQLRMREELEYAREIQLSMLPRESPQVDWLELSAVSLPATEVGGDYFDYFELDAERLAVVSGDVAGHGTASGIVLSGVRSCLTLLSEELDQPKRVMEKLQSMVLRTNRHRMLVTLSILLLDRKEMRGTVTSAGHPPVLIRRLDGTVEEIAIESLPLGVAMAKDFEETVFSFGRGDVILIQTDGVYETPNELEEQYGLERLERLITEWNGEGSAQSLRDLVIRDLWSFKGETPQEDDITLVVAKVL